MSDCCKTRSIAQREFAELENEIKELTAAFIRTGDGMFALWIAEIEKRMNTLQSTIEYESMLAGMEKLSLA